MDARHSHLSARELSLQWTRTDWTFFFFCQPKVWAVLWSSSVALPQHHTSPTNTVTRSVFHFQHMFARLREKAPPRPPLWKDNAHIPIATTMSWSARSCQTIKQNVGNNKIHNRSWARAFADTDPLLLPPFPWSPHQGLPLCKHNSCLNLKQKWFRRNSRSGMDLIRGRRKTTTYPGRWSPSSWPRSVLEASVVVMTKTRLYQHWGQDQEQDWVETETRTVQVLLHHDKPSEWTESSAFP